MDIQQEVRQSVIFNVADVFMKDEAFIEANPDLVFRSEFRASSIEIYPLISAFEDQFDIALDFHDFENNATTTNNTINYLLKQIELQRS